MEWSDQEIQTLVSLYQDMTASKIAERMGKKTHAIQRMAHILGLRKKNIANWKPIGSERVDKDRGQILRKVRDTGIKSQDWKRVDVIEWEEINGPKPDGMILFIKDRSKPRGADNLELGTVDSQRKKMRVPVAEIGKVRVRDGIQRVKVAGTGVREKDWKRLDVIAWENVHGPIPPNLQLKIVDQSKPRTLENLALFTPAQWIAYQQQRSQDPEILELIQLKRLITRAVNRAIKRSAPE